MPSLVLGREQGGVGLDKGLDLRDRGDKALHLPPVQGDREATKAVDRKRALLGDLEGDALGLGSVGQLELEGFVLLGKVGEDGHWHDPLHRTAEAPNNCTLARNGPAPNHKNVNAVACCIAAQTASAVHHCSAQTPGVVASSTPSLTLIYSSPMSGILWSAYRLHHPPPGRGRVLVTTHTHTHHIY